MDRKHSSDFKLNIEVDKRPKINFVQRHPIFLYRLFSKSFFGAGVPFRRSYHIQVSSFKNLTHENKNLHSNVFSKLSATLHTVLPTSAPPTPNLLHPLQICSTHTKFAPPTPTTPALSFSDVSHVSTLYQHKTKTHKSIFVSNANKYPDQIFSASIPLAHSPYPLRSVAHSPHHSTQGTVEGEAEVETISCAFFLLCLVLYMRSSSSSFYIMLHIKSDKYVYTMVCFKRLCT